jgi:hypothetical protein
MIQQLSRISFEKRISDLRIKYNHDNIPEELLFYCDVSYLDDLHYALEPQNGFEPSDVNPIFEKYDWPANVFLLPGEMLCSVRWAIMKDNAGHGRFDVKKLKQHRKHDPAVVIFRYDSVLDEHTVEERAYLDGYKMDEKLIKKMKIKKLKDIS